MRKNTYLTAAAAVVLVGIGGSAWAQQERGGRAELPRALLNFAERALP